MQYKCRKAHDRYVADLLTPKARIVSAIVQALLSIREPFDLCCYPRIFNRARKGYMEPVLSTFGT